MDLCLSGYQDEIVHSSGSLLSKGADCLQQRTPSVSASAFSSPAPEDPLAVVTVDDFLRHRANDYCKTTYSRRRTKRLISSSLDLPTIAAFKEPSESESDADHLKESPLTPDIVTSRERRIKAGKSVKTRKKKTRSFQSLPFSKRMLRAALLTGVDPEEASLKTTHTPVPLKLVPFADSDLSPPRVRKRARLLDIHELQNARPSFSNTNKILKKPCRPFLEWNTPLSLFSALPGGYCRPRSDNILRKQRGPKRCVSDVSGQRNSLRLVSFTEHEEAVAARSFSYVQQRDLNGNIHRLTRLIARRNRKGLARVLLCVSPLLLRPPDLLQFLPR